jgi:hypothetical protein
LTSGPHQSAALFTLTNQSLPRVSTGLKADFSISEINKPLKIHNKSILAQKNMKPVSIFF